MGTYWDSFIREYEKEILKVNIRQLLNAFWLYCNSDKNGCDDIMKK